MVEPTLIHPVDVEIQQKDAAASFYREDAREPVRTLVRKADLVLKAQIAWKRAGDPRATLEGPAEDWTGYLLFKLKDLNQAGITLQRGDRVIKIDKVEQNLYLTQLRPAGHYPDQGGATLLKAFFADRAP